MPVKVLSMYVYASKSINRPIGVVWQAVTDVERMDEWSPVEGPIDTAVRTEGELVGVGSRLIRYYSHPGGEPIGESIVEVTEYDPPRRLALSSTEHDHAKLTFTIQLDSDGDDATVVSLRNGDPSPGGIFRFFGNRPQRRMLVRMLSRLREQIEAE